MESLFLKRPREVLLLAPVLLGACSGFYFHPERGLRLTPDALGLRYEDCRFRADDGVELHGWWLPARGTPRATVVFLHGNAENISTHLASVAWLPARGFSVLTFDYRGYGLSSGTPDFPGVQRDAIAAFRLAADAGAPVVGYGQSIGGAIALDAVAAMRDEAPVVALVVEAAPSDYRRIAREILGSFWLTRPLRVPLAWLAPAEPSPLEAARGLRGLPILFVHGELDRVVPPHHSEALYRAAGPGAELWLVPGAGHIQSFQSAGWRARLVAFLARALHEAEATTALEGRSDSIRVPSPFVARSCSAHAPEPAPSMPSGRDDTTDNVAVFEATLKHRDLRIARRDARAVDQRDACESQRGSPPGEMIPYTAGAREVRGPCSARAQEVQSDPAPASARMMDNRRCPTHRS